MVTTSSADAAASETRIGLPLTTTAPTMARVTMAAICSGPSPMRTTRASAIPIPSAIPITISAAARLRWPSEADTPMSAATEAKMGRSWPNTCWARNHAAAVASAACANHPWFARRRSAIRLGRERSTASPSISPPRSAATLSRGVGSTTRP
jgi:hypothetical protein